MDKNIAISIKKKKEHLMLDQPSSGKLYNEAININGQKLKVADKFIYLIRETLFPEQCILMMNSLPELQKPVWHLIW